MSPPPPPAATLLFLSHSPLSSGACSFASPPFGGGTLFDDVGVSPHPPPLRPPRNGWRGGDDRDSLSYLTSQSNLSLLFSATSFTAGTTPNLRPLFSRIFLSSFFHHFFFQRGVRFRDSDSQKPASRETKFLVPPVCQSRRGGCSSSIANEPKRNLNIFLHPFL